MSTRESQDEGGTAHLCTSRRRDEESRSTLNDSEEVMETRQPENAGLDDITQELLDSDGDDDDNDDEEDEVEQDAMDIDEEDEMVTEGNEEAVTYIEDEDDDENGDVMEIGEDEFRNQGILEAASKDKKQEIFALFPRLPLELQIDIWKIALPEPKVVQLRMMAIPKSVIKPAVVPGSIQRKSQSNYIRANISLSPLLSTCKVSRQIMLETYTLSIPAKGDWRFCVDDKVDWLVLNDAVLAEGLNGATLGLELDKCRVYENALRGVKRLVFPGKYLLKRGQIANFGHWLLSLLSSLDTLIVYSKSVSAPEETWNYDNLCLLTDQEFWDGLQVGTSDFVRDEIKETDEKLEVFREELVKVGGRCPVVRHMWLYRKSEVVGEADEVVLRGGGRTGR